MVELKVGLLHRWCCIQANNVNMIVIHLETELRGTHSKASVKFDDCRCSLRPGVHIDLDGN